MICINHVNDQHSSHLSGVPDSILDVHRVFCSYSGSVSRSHESAQTDRVHTHGIYDVEVDTSVHSPMECALQIRSALKDIHSADAFEQLRKRLSSETVLRQRSRYSRGR